MGEPDERKGKEGTPTRVRFHITPTREDSITEDVFDFSKVSSAVKETSAPGTCTCSIRQNMVSTKLMLIYRWCSMDIV